MLGETRAENSNFRNDLKLPVEWKENFDMGKEDFRKLCNKFQP